MWRSRASVGQSPSASPGAWVGISLSLAACAGTPARSDPAFAVRPDLRASVPIRLPAAATVSAMGAGCGREERARAEAALGALARELGMSGFVLIGPKDPVGAGEATQMPVVALDLEIALDDCERGLFGDVALTLTSTGGARIDRVGIDDVWFSNIAGLASDLADRVAGSSAVAKLAAQRGGGK